MSDGFLYLRHSTLLSNVLGMLSDSLKATTRRGKVWTILQRNNDNYVYAVLENNRSSARQDKTAPRTLRELEEDMMAVLAVVIAQKCARYTLSIPIPDYKKYHIFCHICYTADVIRFILSPILWLRVFGS